MHVKNIFFKHLITFMIFLISTKPLWECVNSTWSQYRPSICPYTQYSAIAEIFFFQQHSHLFSTDNPPCIFCKLWQDTAPSSMLNNKIWHKSIFMRTRPYIHNKQKSFSTSFIHAFGMSKNVKVVDTVYMNPFLKPLTLIESMFHTCSCTYTLQDMAGGIWLHVSIHGL